MINPKLAIFVFALASLGFSTPATACDLAFTQTAQSVTLTAGDVGPNVVVQRNAAIQFQNNAAVDCQAFLRVSRINGAELGGVTAAQLSSRGQKIEVLASEFAPASLSGDLFIGAIPGGGTDVRSLPLHIDIPVGWGARSGTTSEDLRLQLVSESGAVLDEAVLTVNLSVLPSVELRIVGATGNDRIARIDLGTLDPRAMNRSDPFGIRVWSTSPYSVSFTSANSGQLMHTLMVDSIDYNMRVSGRAVELLGDTPSILGLETDALGEFHPLEISVPPFFATAGDYADRVQVTLSAS